MTGEAESGEERRHETVEILLTELKDGMERQFQAIDGLDRKAGIIFGSASLVVALMTVAHGAFFQKGLEPSCSSTILQAGFATAGFVYVGIISCMLGALRVRTFYLLPLKPDRDEVHKGYLGLTRAEVREQLLANYIEHFGINLVTISNKARWVQLSLLLLVVDSAYLTILVIAATYIIGP